MKTLQGVFFIVAWMVFSSCNPKISTSISRNYPPIDFKQDIVVIGLDQPEPDNSEFLGQVKIEDNGFTTNCSFDIVIDQAKLEARKAGGNAIKIIKHKRPTLLGSACHRITARILKIENIDNCPPTISSTETLLDVDYAVLNVYRYSGAGALVSYDLNLGDSLICRVKNNFKTTLNIKKEGMNALWAKTEAKTEVSIDLEKGKTYYLRCGITMGALVGHPKLELIDSKTGKAEFESFKAKNQ